MVYGHVFLDGKKYGCAFGNNREESVGKLLRAIAKSVKHFGKPPMQGEWEKWDKKAFRDDSFSEWDVVQYEHAKEESNTEEAKCQRSTEETK